MIIQVRIERLVLDGLPLASADAPTVRAAVEAELSRLLAANPASTPVGVALDRLPAGSLDLVAPVTAGQVGAGAARQVASAVRAATSGSGR